MPVVKNLQHELAFFNAMSGTDPFTVVIRAAAFLDYELDRFIESRVAVPSAWTGVRIDFQNRCAIAEALGLPRYLRPPLRKIGKIRNDLAHQPTRNLTAADVAELRSSLNALAWTAVENSLSTLAARRLEPTANYDALETLDRFVIIVVTVRTIIFAQHRLRTAPERIEPT